MKKLYFLLLLSSFNSFSQNFGRYYNSWRLGINMGGMWQTADVRSTAGGAFGFTLEKGLLENEKNFFSLAIRGRGLFGNTYGLDYTRNYNIKDNPALNGTYDPNVNYDSASYIYNNYKTEINEGALELQISFNRLRQRTGIILNLWGGVGITGYRANIDLLDGSNKRYNYYKVDSLGTGTPPDVLSAHKNLLDGKYESRANGSKNGNVITFSPSAGIGWGYQFGPGFSLILEYKVTFPQGAFADHLDGIRNPNKDMIAGSNDYYHYAGINFLFTLRGKGKGTSTSSNNVSNYTPVTTNTSAIVSPSVPVVETTTPVGKKPIVKIVNPPYSPFNVTSNTFNIKAKVYNVTSRNQLNVVYNGSGVSNYTYNGTDIEFPVLLNPGNNNVTISATNQDGSDSKSAVVNYQGAPPVIVINNPPSNPHSTNTTPITINANVTNVNSSNDISVRYNGNVVNFFSYSVQNGAFSVQLPLNKGANNFEITATNLFGKDLKNLTINYAPTVAATGTVSGKPVTVTILDPSTNPKETSQGSYNVKANVTGVSVANQVSVSVNGSPINFTYNAGSVTFNTGLIPGSNIIQVSAASRTSSDSKSTVINYIAQKTPVPPTVVIINPSPSPHTTKFPTYFFKAQVKNISNKTQLEVKFNNTNVSNFLFNAGTGLIEFNTGLVENTDNVFEVKATNPDGAASASAVVKYSIGMSTGEVKTKVICHRKDRINFETMTIPESEWPAHKQHGDLEGACNTGTVTESESQITICHKNADGSKQTLSIKSSEWSAHQAHGDVQGACPKVTDLGTPDANIVICHKNADGSKQTLTIKTSEWAAHQAHGDVQGACPKVTDLGTPDANIVICHKNADGSKQTLTIKTSEWASHQAHGDVQGACPKVMDGGTSDPDLVICHKNANGTKQTLTVKASEWTSHQAHGDVQGACPMLEGEGTEETLVICHKNANGTKQTMTIKQSEWLIHQKHGDSQGECVDKKITICHLFEGSYQTMEIKESEWPMHQSHGDTQGACAPQENKIKICHHSPRDPNETQEIEIPESLWPQHQAHGDTKGPCPPPDKKITICHNAGGTTQTIEIKESEWPSHQAHGDVKGTCPPPENKIKICHHPPGNPDNTQELEIPESAWPAHEAHGDTKGTCPPKENKIKICHHPPGNPDNTQELEIPESAWPAHEAHGDTKGACPPKENKIKICHHPPGNPDNTQELEIPESAWPAHQAHGDTKGTCPPPDKKITICHHAGGSTQTIEIKESEWPSHAAHGDTKGQCPPPEKKIIICHHPPGNPDNSQELEIPESAWPAHEAHGDTKGTCPPKENKIKICHHPPGNPDNTQELEIPESAWPAHEAHGDTKGSCPPKNNGGGNEGGNSGGGNSGGNSGGNNPGTGNVETGKGKITICHIPPGNNSNPQTIEIPESAWPAHEAHGDSKGACPQNRTANPEGGKKDVKPAEEGGVIKPGGRPR